MGINTELVILTENKTLDIPNSIFRALKEIQQEGKETLDLSGLSYREKAKYNFLDIRYHHWHSNRYKEAVYETVTLKASFTYGKEDRTLNILIGSDSDYEGEGLHGPKIILSLSCWGSSEYITMYVAKYLSQTGLVGSKALYYRQNDCTDDFTCIY